MRRLTTILGATVASLFLAGAAYADTFDFNIVAPSVGTTQSAVTAIGTFTGTVSSPGVFSLTGITGTLTASNFAPGTFNITGLASSPGDNLLYFGNPTTPFFDAAGVTFNADNGAQRINVSFQSGSYLLQAVDVGGSGTAFATVAQANVLGTPGPIAGAGLVPLLGLAGAYLFGRKRLAA